MKRGRRKYDGELEGKGVTGVELWRKRVRWRFVYLNENTLLVICESDIHDFLFVLAAFFFSGFMW